MADSLQRTLESLLASGRCTRIEVDLTEHGVICPDAIRKQCENPVFHLDLALSLTDKLMVDELGIDIEINIDNHIGCRFIIPWHAIRAIIDRDAICSATFSETTATGTDLLSFAKAHLTPTPTWKPGDLIGLLSVTSTMSVHEYRILSRLGRGGFGVVDLVRLWNDDTDTDSRSEHSLLQHAAAKPEDAQMLHIARMFQEDPARRFDLWTPRGRLAAVKSPQRDVTYSPTELQRFFDEGIAWLDLPPHRNVVTCHSVRWVDGLPRIFAEYVSGGSLAEWISEGRLYSRNLCHGNFESSDLETILGVAIELAQGVEHAHRHGIIHQDIKPANVLMTEGGIAMLTDFGLARVGRLVPRSCVGSTWNPDGTTTLAATLVGGTPGFRAPELEWTGFASRRSDIWSWAVTVLAMFVQGAPEPDEHGDAWLERIVTTGPLAARRVPPERLLALLRRCLSRDPDARPTCMTEIIEVLEHIHHRLLHKSYGPRREWVRQIQVDEEHDRAVSWIELGRPEKSEMMLRNFLTKHPHHTLAVYNLGLIEMRAGLITPHQLIARIENCPSMIDLPTDIARACIVADQGDREQAHRLLNKIDGWTRKFVWVTVGGRELSGIQEEEHYGWNLGQRASVKIVRRPSSVEHFFALLRTRLSDERPFVAPFLLSA